MGNKLLEITKSSCRRAFVEYFKRSRVVYVMNWWFKFGDFILDKAGMSNNAGNFKFRNNMKILWFCLWASILALTPDRYELFPLLAVLVAGYVWSRDSNS